MRPSSRKTKKPRLAFKHLLLLLAVLVFGGVGFSVYLTIRATVDNESSSVTDQVVTSPNQGLKGFQQRTPTKIQKKKKTKTKLPQHHVVFSTGCSEQQDWESYVFFYHAFKVKQPGNVTRLVAGCSVNEERKLRKFHNESIRTMSERFHVHFTPHYGMKGKVFESEYKYNNKPNSLYHWMANVLHMNQQKKRSTGVEDGIIVLMDPDMILLRPLTGDFSNQNMIYASSRPQTNIVRHGQAMAQQDGYLSNEWQTFNVTHITQGGTFPTFKPKDGPMYYNSGPPYLATVGDFWKIVNLWKDYVPRVYAQFPELFAEMYGLIIAYTQLNLPHTLVKSIVVSTTTTRGREGWQYVDALPDDQVCDVQAWKTIEEMPIVLHYCKRYLLGKFFFSKYRLKKKFISCKAPLLTPPPQDIVTRYNYWVRPPPDRGASHEMETKNITVLQAKREAFMLCGLISAMNEASRYYKTQHCGGKGNFSETYDFHTDPHS